MKSFYFFVAFFIGINLLNACKKDQLNIDREKSYVQIEPKVQVSDPYFGGWSLTLYPNDIADINPGGDIIYRGTYKISGSSLKVKTDNDFFKFKIVSSTDIKSDKYYVVLRLNK